MIRYSFLLLLIILVSSCSTSGKSINSPQLICDTIQIKRDMDSIVNTSKYRNYRNLISLNQVANYIKREFQSVSDSVVEQNFNYQGTQYKNIICSINTQKQERIIIGAHYDVCGDQDGADDNASGVVGLLELARLLKNEKLNYRIDFVAYSLEEPPFFRSDFMGSNIHAKYLYDNKIAVKGMICLEMIGYFSDKPNSQDYPVGFLSWFYGKKGDYITVVQKFWNGKFGDDVKRLMQKSKLLPTKSFIGPSSLQGIDFSDHRNYWKYGYSSVMITNTSFYRNKNYHEKTDKIETLDFNRMALTVDELYLTIRQLK